MCSSRNILVLQSCERVGRGSRFRLWLTEEVYDDDWVVRGGLLGVVARLVEQEGGHVGREDGRVDDQDQDDPVPEGLEGRVVEDGPFVNAWRLQLVLLHHIGAEGKDLEQTGEEERRKLLISELLPWGRRCV